MRHRLAMTGRLRTLDRLRLRVRLTDEEVASPRATILALIGSLERVEVGGIVLERTARPRPTELGTLYAIHVAMEWQLREEARQR